ncbi:relaxase/mobilization nuclease domain-containing protein [Mucilaginibacter aquatilis]|uniref:Relaxase/mobilization nuclease domain-containing protein n=1 Tax=Mucilaginibacter aquatilis TaxID=1517760 RepID=A0A6I4I8G0_9SPHI|nr:relaxase/mobilization nuclease domain-containing protein [Mucilaginibacter aquatilis]MVN91535.1 relaxase/mobilization nuclease domain-containing protein [Mucilaginibacter aquatilis]
MVAKIKSGKSLIGALNYNERKVAKGTAKLIAAVRYSKDMDKLNFHDKLLRLTDLAAGNERTKTNTVHISLNFPNGERLSDDRLQQITQDYMIGIGFDGQPYLVYRHEDAGHPHIHIVTTNIKSDGERISLHYLGQNQSEKARKEIEVKYQLTKAEDQKLQKPDMKAGVKAADYGQEETKRSITNILGYVVRTYKFTSLPELNAVLQQYHIAADQGSKDSRMYARSGLMYWMLDSKGNKIGVPIKASSIYGKPTLKALEERFKLNATLRKPFKKNLIKVLDEMLKHPLTAQQLQKQLWAKGVQIILRRNEEGRLYGVTFIDKNNKAVFNGSDLGKTYSANQLATKLLPEPKQNRQTQTDDWSPTATDHGQSIRSQLLDVLFEAEQQDLAALNKFKRKKRKGLNL